MSGGGPRTPGPPQHPGVTPVPQQPLHQGHPAMVSGCPPPAPQHPLYRCVPLPSPRVPPPGWGWQPAAAAWGGRSGGGAGRGGGGGGVAPPGCSAAPTVPPARSPAAAAPRPPGSPGAVPPRAPPSAGDWGSEGVPNTRRPPDPPSPAGAAKRPPEEATHTHTPLLRTTWCHPEPPSVPQSPPSDRPPPPAPHGTGQTPTALILIDLNTPPPHTHMVPSKPPNALTAVGNVNTPTPYLHGTAQANLRLPGLLHPISTHPNDLTSRCGT